MSQKREEDVTYADFNVKKYTDAGKVAGGLVRRFMERCADHVARLAPPGATILDVGAGEGTMTDFLAQRLPDRRVLAVEYEDESSTLFGRTYPSLSIARASAYSLPFPDDGVDLACAFEVLEHLGDPRTALREMARVARKHVVITVPYEPFFRMGNVARGRYLSRLGNTPGHINHWRAGTLARLVREGSQQASVDRVFPWLMATLTPRSQRT